MAEAPRLSVVVPVLNDAEALGRLLDELAAARMTAPFEVIVVDGGSRDGSAEVAVGRGRRVIHASAGRGSQLAAGAASARGTWLWFLHADSRDVVAALAFLLGLPVTAEPPHHAWGRFDIRFQDATPALRLVALAMNRRSRLTGICTGDQGMFVHRDVLAAVGGVPEQPLMEDVELSRRLKRWGAPASRRETLTSSPRRWQRDGVMVTIVSMWWFRLRYWLGVDAARLAREYYR